MRELSWPEGVKANDALPGLMAHQRIAGVYPNSFVVAELTKRGFDSAHKIASLPEDQFVDEMSEVFNSDLQAARLAHQKAATIKGQVIHLWATVQGVVASAHSRALRSDNIGDDVIEFFSGLPTYQELFGTLDYCECEHCQSIFGAAAYFVDLMRITDRYVTQPNIKTIPKDPPDPIDFTLESRRRGLFTMPITCASTNDLVPYLQIVNEVLEARASQELKTEDVFNTLAQAVYPFDLPFNVFLNEIRLYVYLLQTSLAEVYRMFAPPPTDQSPANIAIDREILGLSVEQLKVVTTPTPDEASLKLFYGLGEQSLSTLNEEPVFRRQTGLSRDDLDMLFKQDLDKAELEAKLAHEFFINFPLPDGEYIFVETPGEGPNQIRNLTLDTLDRISRFVRLSQWTGIAFADLDWMLTSIAATEITEDVLRQLAPIKEASAVYRLPRDVMAAFWYDMKTIGVGFGEYPADLFDRVYNNPSLIKGMKPYHPLYEKNPLYLDTVVPWKINSTERVSDEFGRPRLMAALGLSDTNLTAIGEALFGANAEVELNVPNLSALYRMSVILSALKLSLSDYLTLLSLLELNLKDAFEPGNLIELNATILWLRLNRLAVSDLNYILTGETGDSSPPAPSARAKYKAMKTLWVLNQPGLLQPESFAADVITPEQSKEAFSALLKKRKPPLIASVRIPYEKVFEKPTDTAIAIVLKAVEVTDLDFLKTIKFTNKQIKIVAKVLNATYTSQLELLDKQLSALFKTSPEILNGLRYYVAAVLPIEPFIQLLLTPVLECEQKDKVGGKCKKFGAEWHKVLSLLDDLSRAAFIATSLKVTEAALVSMADDPAAYGITEPLEPTLDVVRSILNLNALETAFGDAEEELLEYLAMPSDTLCSEGEKSAALASLTGWDRMQICRVADYLGAGTAIYDTVAGIVLMKHCFDILARTGMDAFFIENLLKLRDFTAESANWNTYKQTARSLVAIANAKNAANWDEVNGKVVSTINESKRDAVERVVLWKLRQIDPSFTSTRQLYEFLLIDVDMSGCVQISYIAEGINAVQLYLQRARLNLEPGVERVPIPQLWWEWMMNYRVWEANRKIFLYPENYLIPSLRGSKTTIFKTLEERLQQSDMRKNMVEEAFRGYLDGLVSLATLTYVDAYQCVVDDAHRAPVETLFLFTRTKAEPYTYYYNSKETGRNWSEWMKIEVPITSPYITPVYAFNRLFIFWVELKQVSSSQIQSDPDDNGGQPNSQNQRVYSKNQQVYAAAIRYSFYSFTGNWVAPQTLYEEQVAYVAPSKTPFSDASGYQLFDIDNLYWHKANALRVMPDSLNSQPENTSATEKVVVLYGPFIENNVTGGKLEVPLPPETSVATQNPPLYAFHLNNHNNARDVNQALQSPQRGSVPLIEARTLNRDLNLDFLLRNTEFLMLVENRSAGIPPGITPKLDVALATLNVTTSHDLLRTNYYGDYTPNISTALQPKRVLAEAFIALGIDENSSGLVFNTLRTKGIILPETNKVSPTFSLNTDLSYLFTGVPEKQKTALIAVVQEILLNLRAKDLPAQETSFLLPEITGDLSKTIHKTLKEKGIITDALFVEQRFTSATNLSFLFSGAPEQEKQLLIFEVRRVLFEHLGEPALLVATARNIATTIMVKNQPNSFIFNNGDEAFLVAAESVPMPLLDSETTRVLDVSSEPTAFDYSFVTQDIDLALSKQAFAQLKQNPPPDPILDAEGRLNPDFGPDTDLSFLFAGTVPEPRKSLLIAEVREILLNLPSITGLRYYLENDDLVINDQSFLAPGIDAAESAIVFAKLRDEGIIGENGIIDKRFSATDDLSFLFPNKDAQTRKVLTEEVRATLLSFYAGTWQRNIHDLRFRFDRLTTGSVARLSRSLFAGGIDNLLALESQQIPVVPELPFTRYKPEWRVIRPAQFDGTQVDFSGPYGLYYWELFFFSPQLIGTSVLADRRFEEALKWFQFIFNPTVREKPLAPDSFMTPDISRAESEQAYSELKVEKLITEDDEVSHTFDENTYLGFLWPDENIPEEKKERMIREVRNVMLNSQLSKPSARFWQFQPFRNHTLQDLQDILTDPAQIAIYNNDPFDPFAIARLRIGSFEKAIVMNYLDNLINWGDSMFVRYTWESLTAATMLYIYAYNLLGEKPPNVGPCPTQPPTNFEKIRKKYQGQPGGIPQFLIDMENFIPVNPIIAPGLLGKPFNEIDAYFCVPENAQMLAYWDKVEDRLYKIRHCLDLEGKPLKLPLFAPPINPLELVRAAAAGQPGLSVLEQQRPSIPPYRFASMLPHARTLTDTVTTLGSSLLTALDMRDGEALARLRTSQELAILNLTTYTMTQQVENARFALESLQETANAIKSKQDFYQRLVDENLSPAEISNLVFSSVALPLNILSGSLEAASGIAYAIPQVGSPFAMTYGGIQLGSVLAAAANSASTYAQIADFAAQTSLTVGGYQRRAQDWRFQVDQAKFEAKQTQKQIDAAQTLLLSAQRELEIHLASIAQAKEMQEFLTTKFDTQELYSWIAGRISTLYFQAYKLALDAALATQSAYRYELIRDDTFVNFDYWDNLRQGLTAGEGLTAALNQMDRAFMQNNTRRLLILKDVSLASVAPAELYRLKTKGVCNLKLTEAMFDFDYPGHYCRQIKVIEVVLVTGGDEDEENGGGGGVPADIHLTLTQIHNDLVIKATPEAEAVQYLLNPQGDPPLTIRSNWQSQQQIAVSNEFNAAGIHQVEFSFSEERYLPFEGTGAVSEWEIRLPLETNHFNFELISDLVMTVTYYALDGGKDFRDKVEQLLSGDQLRGAVYRDLGETFPDAWEELMTNHDDPNSQTLEFDITACELPANLKRMLLDVVFFQLDVSCLVALPASSQFMSLTVVEEPEQPIQLNGPYGVVTFVDVPQDKFKGTWKLTVDLTKMRSDPNLRELLDDEGFLDPELFEDLEIMFEYKACVFNCT
ncbi:MAG: neuraminidase-like domain-containing protein [Gammaproteobacteria bacterium]